MPLVPAPRCLVGSVVHAPNAHRPPPLPGVCTRRCSCAPPAPLAWCSNLVAALLPARGKFVPDEEELQERPKGPLQDPRISILEPKVRGRAPLHVQSVARPVEG